MVDFRNGLAVSGHGLRHVENRLTNGDIDLIFALDVSDVDSQYISRMLTPSLPSFASTTPPPCPHLRLVKPPLHRCAPPHAYTPHVSPYIPFLL